ncbi:actinohivin-like [Folsomia candida]|uniref:actinohivin-like n=1 Tax=Folsomia candida TaxID=158441 RepID=UPI000B8FCED6|nr:actinohivin-like [Folsomia candida]
MLFAISVLVSLSVLGGGHGRRFKDGLTGKCLDNMVKGGHKAKGSAHTNPCNGGKFQMWHWGKDHTILNAATKQCLDSDGKTIYTMSCNGGKNQKWRTDGVGGVVNFATRKCLKSSMKGLVFPQECNVGRKSWLE